MDVVAVVVVRAGAEVLVPLGVAPVVVRAVRALLPAVDAVHLLVPASGAGPVVDACSALPVSAHDDPAGLAELLVAGAHGGQRAGTTDGDDPVTGRFGDGHGSTVLVVHDAARPLAPRALVDSVVDAVRAGHDVVVPVLQLADTVKRVDVDGVVRATPDRAGLRVVQTPQGFRGALAPLVLPAAAVDPAHAWAAAGAAAHTIAGDPLAFALRDVEDVRLAGSLLEAPR